MRKMKKLLVWMLILAFLAAFAMPAAASTTTVTVKYVTGEKNKTIAKSAKITGEPGDFFQVDIKDIKGYTYIGFTHPSENSFIFPDKDITMLVHYAKGVKATVNYVDQNGSTILASTSLSGKTGDSYTVPQPYIQGYTFAHIKDPEHGLFGDKNHTITVVYNRVNWAPSATMVNLRVQCVDQDSGKVLMVITDSNVPISTVVNLNSYNHNIPGHSFTGVSVNGAPATRGTISLGGDTLITYYYISGQPWPIPVVETAHLYVYAVCEETGDVIRVLQDQDVQIGTIVSLVPPSLPSFEYDYTDVGGAQRRGNSIIVNYDTVVAYYYRMLFLGGTPGAGPSAGPLAGRVSMD